MSLVASNNKTSNSAVEDEPPPNKKQKQDGFPPELVNVDFSQHISWGKYAPYKTDRRLDLTAEGAPPTFDKKSSPALCHHVNATCGRARACTIHLQPQPGQPEATPVPTPIFMPVGTKGALKGLEISELTRDPALSCPIILGNTYHLTIQPGSELVRDMNGLHAFQGALKVNQNENGSSSSSASSYNLLTDSGGFQMVSLVKLSKITEEGVSFENPFKNNNKKLFTSGGNTSSSSAAAEQAVAADGAESAATADMLLLRPEDSIRHQNNISANIIMALDDVVSSVAEDDERFTEATYRTLRWYDRCVKAHAHPDRQNLFPIVQGALDTKPGGLREICLAGFRYREETLNYTVPGYAIGGLAGGESKDDFWRVVDQCCRALPDNKPRYLMGVGYPLDCKCCVDMYTLIVFAYRMFCNVCVLPSHTFTTLTSGGMYGVRC